MRMLPNGYLWDNIPGEYLNIFSNVYYKATF